MLELRGNDNGREEALVLVSALILALACRFCLSMATVLWFVNVTTRSVMAEAATLVGSRCVRRSRLRSKVGVWAGAALSASVDTWVPVGI